MIINKSSEANQAENSTPIKLKNSQLAAKFVVGLGASAGGLDAFKTFFQHMPDTSGFSFILISHLDPDHESLLPEIIQRVTSMTVLTARDGMALKENTLLVLPPNRELELDQNRLRLKIPHAPHGQRMPIDLFLHSLAKEQGQRAVAIILSGTGHDGALGATAVHSAGGACLIQAPDTTPFNGMPNSAIAAVPTAKILPVEQMPALLLKWSTQGMLRTSPVHNRTFKATNLKPLLTHLQNVTGHDFSHYKRTTLSRCIDGRMHALGIQKLSMYTSYVEKNPREAKHLFRDMLINVTSFFRDPLAFKQLKSQILPELFLDRGEDDVFRVWVAGGSTGEEAYSLAIVFQEFLNEHQQRVKVLIYCTDIKNELIAFARAGLYPFSICKTVSAERIERFFSKEKSGYRVSRSIREKVVFANQDLTRDPPFKRLDLISCRNVLIYFDPGLQDDIIRLFHSALKPGGFLFLSPSESIGKHADLFSAVDRKWKLYKSTRHLIAHRTMKTMDSSESKNGREAPATDLAPRPNLPEIARRALLASFAPASVLVDSRGDMLYVHGDTSKYLRPAPGEATLNVIRMARDDLQFVVESTIRAVKDTGVASTQEITTRHEDQTQSLNLIVRPLFNPDTGLNLFLLSFQPIPYTPPRKIRKRSSKGYEQERIEALEHQLAYTRENLQTTIEDQQTANAEMQSINEELQATNEELETSKEELQSVNAELETINAELQSKVDQLADLQNDMKNLLDNVSVATVFLDNQLVIRRFTREATQLYHFVPADEGRPLEDINSQIENVDMIAQARQVLATKIPWESEVHISNGAGYLARIVPYRTLSDLIDGVVLTFTDISQRIEQERSAQVARELAENIIDTVRDPLVVLDDQFNVVTASQPFYELLDLPADVLVGKSLFIADNKQWDSPELHAALESVRDRNDNIDNLNLILRSITLGERHVVLNARRVLRAPGKALLILLAIDGNTQDASAPFSVG